MLPDNHKSFALGFGCCLLMFLSLLCILMEIGRGERGSGRIDLGGDNTVAFLAEATKGQQSPERPPARGNGRKDSTN
ncbi:MAG TPA: hypothetical protein VK211_03660 [Kamptonema sp.]|nr:hypothetical protein [Kamptonema sp.]